MRASARALIEEMGVEQGKGGKNRYVPLADDVLQVLRRHWRTARPAGPRLFAALGDAAQPLNPCNAQRWYEGARAAAGIIKHGGIHTAQRRAERAAALRRHDWVVYAKTALAGPAAVLDYLSRYTHRTAIGNERLLAIEGDAMDGLVRLRVRAGHHGGKRCITMPGQQFIHRLLQHILPTGFKLIRHDGLLAPAAKADRLALARQLLAMPAADPQLCEDAQAFMRRVAAIDIGRCTHCPNGRWSAFACMLPHCPGTARAECLMPASAPASHACRGPPKSPGPLA